MDCNEPRLGDDGEGPQIAVDPTTPSGRLVEAIFSEDVGSVQSLVRDHPELTQQSLEHRGRVYAEWTCRRLQGQHNLNHWLADAQKHHDTITEPTIVFACLVPLYKHPARENRAISPDSLIIARLLVEMKRANLSLDTIGLSSLCGISPWRRGSLGGLASIPATLLHQAVSRYNAAII